MRRLNYGDCFIESYEHNKIIDDEIIELTEEEKKIQKERLKIDKKQVKKNLKTVCKKTISKFINETLIANLQQVSDELINLLRKNKYNIDFMTSITGIYVKPTDIPPYQEQIIVTAKPETIKYEGFVKENINLWDKLYDTITSKVKNKEKDIILLYIPVMHREFIGFTDCYEGNPFNKYFSTFYTIVEGE